MAVRERLDRRNAAGRRYTTLRAFTYAGRKYDKGDAFPVDGLSFHNIQTLHGSRYIDLVPAGSEAERTIAEAGVTLTDNGGGYYEITADWLESPIKIRGKAKAETEAARIRTEGPPLGFIKGGSEVAVEDVGGGWYALTAPWLEMPEKVHGRDLAEERQRAIHEAGEPASHHGVALTDSGGGWFDVKADWEPETEKVQGEEAARARAAELRAAGPPQKGEPGEPEPADEIKTGSVVIVEGGDLDGLRAAVEKIEGENAEVVGFAAGNESDGSDLKRGTVPLASLKLAPDQPAATE